MILLAGKFGFRKR